MPVVNRGPRFRLGAPTEAAARDTAGTSRLFADSEDLASRPEAG